MSFIKLMDLFSIATSSGAVNFVAGEVPLKKSKKFSSY